MTGTSTFRIPRAETVVSFSGRTLGWDALDPAPAPPQGFSDARELPLAMVSTGSTSEES